ncbi:unnamed protein product [Prorocentrum cordatum]|uniref:Ion transport domain-containing protein n=1 Tax=Prorocentrum cordatum TaxID=2364126 RepID=A0ABN9W172_9DINO|nr:unnamed protein product [Polarella glacialis]
MLRAASSSSSSSASLACALPGRLLAEMSAASRAGEVTVSISVDELRSLLRADTGEVVRAELRAVGALRWEASQSQATTPRSDAWERPCDPGAPGASGPAASAPLRQRPVTALWPGAQAAKERRPARLRRSGRDTDGLLGEGREASLVEARGKLCPRAGGDVLTGLLRLADWLWGIEEPQRTGVLANFVASSAFQAFFVSVIVANAGFMAYAVNVDMQNLRNTEAESPKWLSIVDVSFLCLYCAELLCKLALHRLFYFWGEDMAWNWLDFVLILQGLVDMLCGAGGGRGNTWMRTFRLLRVVKVLRILRVFKFFTQLYAIVSAIVRSMMHLFWSVLMFVIVLFMFSLFIMANASNYLQDLDSLDSKEAAAIIMYFGSFPIAMRTLLLTVSGASDWETFYFALEPISVAQIVYVLFIGFTQIAVLNIVTGIFMLNISYALNFSRPEYHQLAEGHYAEERGACGTDHETAQFCREHGDYGPSRHSLKYKEISGADGARYPRRSLQVQSLGLQFEISDPFCRELGYDGDSQHSVATDSARDPQRSLQVQSLGFPFDVSDTSRSATSPRSWLALG